MDNSNEENWVPIFEELSLKAFGVEPDIFINALLKSPNARGYILGAISELLLQSYLLEQGYHLERIKEKWVGPKIHHGDLYVSKDGTDWYVIESKGLKSNSEKWHRIPEVDVNPKELKKYFNRRKRGEIGRWWQRLSDDRRANIIDAQTFNRAKVLETHFPSGTAGRAGRKIATPLKSEFHIVSIDLFLRTGKHEFAFAPAELLESSASHSDHLKQNYIIDILVPDVDEKVDLVHPWTKDFDSLFNVLEHPVNVDEMQIDERKPGMREIDEIDEIDDELEFEDAE